MNVFHKLYYLMLICFKIYGLLFSIPYFQFFSHFLSLFQQESKNISPNDAFLLEMYELQWACAVMSILEIVDKIAASCLQYRPNMKTDELLATTATWISMLQTLSQWFVFLYYFSNHVIDSLTH